MKTIINVLLIVICVNTVLLTACNTVRGVGQDISDGGQDIKRATH